MICKKIRPGFDVTFGHTVLSLNNLPKLGSWQVDTITQDSVLQAPRASGKDSDFDAR